jgi:hypothetical protein
MSIRNKAIFAGTSNTMGLGLELEFSKRYKDDDYLTNHCKSIPPVDDSEDGKYDTYNQEDIETHRKYRWPNLVCDYFGLEEVNINDPIDNQPFYFLDWPRHAVDIVFNFFDRKEDKKVKKLLDQTKYIFLEFGYIRWWEHDLHGTQSNFKWPSTPVEIDMFLKDKSIDFEKKKKAIDWLNEINPIELWKRTIEKVKELKQSFPEIEIILLAWGVNPDVFNLKETQDVIDLFLELPVDEVIDFNNYNISYFLYENKLQIKDKVMAYNPKYKDKWIYEDVHANSKGHEIIANQVIKKLSNEVRDLYSIQK